ncbi:major facilitator superfamily domain-containing protein [Fennellomyces sp. T-0311]|nr:major facilitator superfamily domain-containing protein [Fennellomyces sp. T-0311]
MLIYKRNIFMISASDIKLINNNLRHMIKCNDHVEFSIPDGGYGWVIVAAACLIQVAGQGIAQSWGVMQDHYDQHYFKNSTFQLSFVGTIANIILNSFGPVAQLLLALMHIRLVIAIAVSLCVIGLEAASWSTQIAMSVVPQWFDKRQGIALGIASTGPSIGAFIMPLLMTTLNTQLDVRWCYRILGLIMLVTGALSCILFKERDNSKKEKPKLKEVFQFDMLRSPIFLLWCLTDIFMEGAYYVPFFYLPAHATYLKLSSTHGSALISVASGMSLAGRLIAGLIADHIGHINTVIIYGAISSLSCLLLWTFSASYAPLMAFAAIFGFFGAAFLTLIIITGIDKFQSGFSAFLLLTTLSMFGPNAAGAIEQKVSAAPFFSYEMFTGFGYLAGVLVLMSIKLLVAKRVFSKI